jgi:hypothetical protein
MDSDDVLYHFVGWGEPTNHEKNFETLCTILECMRVGRYPDDNPSAGIRLIIEAGRTPEKGELIKQSISCFCDIPFDQLKIHTSKYGAFGVGVSRRMLTIFGARPVSYVPQPRSRSDTWGHTLAQELRALVIGIQTHLHPSAPFKEESSRTFGSELGSKEEVINCLESVFHRDLLAYLKFYDSDLPFDHPENYLAEREWRKFLPMPLDISLSEIVIPSGYEEKFLARFPEHMEKLRML